MNIMSTSESSLPRKMTPVGTMGEMGQLFTVYEKNWHCKDCGQENYASRPRCFRCKKQKPVGDKNYVVDDAVAAAQGNKTIAWHEAIDPTSYQIYYYNKETGATQWERPAELGAAPMATGWFGRGVAGSNAAQMYKARNDSYLLRPARKQKDFIDPNKYHLEGSNEYNIWYGKFIGDYDKHAKQEAASDRCHVDEDAGHTKADSGGAKRREKRFFCIHFAHGVCAKGAECVYYHRIPLPEDDASTDELFDCFGRSRHSAHRDDMDGVGSFMKPCRTLFVGNLLKSKYSSPKALEDALWKHFGEWGELEHLNVITRLSIAFPRYRLRTSAEFAKEAMQGQSLDQGEILSIRWAYDDPNPVAQDSISRADKDALTGLLAAKGVSTQEAAFEYPSDYQIPEGKRLRLENGADLASEHPELAYPNTDAQYTSVAAPASVDSGAGAGVPARTMTAEEYAAYCNNYYAYLLSGQSQPPQSSSSSASVSSSVDVNAGGVGVSSFLSDLLKPSSASSTSTAEAIASATVPAAVTASGTEAAAAAVADDSSAPGGCWAEYLDDDTGATYYYNATTGESTWDAAVVATSAAAAANTAAATAAESTSS